LIVNNGLCDSDLSEVFSFTVTGIRDQNSQIGIRLLYNPIQNNTLAFDLIGIENANVTANIYNTIGKNVWNRELPKNSNGGYQIELNGLSEGINLLNIQQGRNSISRKFLWKN
jgi:hypothetical protein